MPKFDNTHWTNEEKTAFEVWLEVSIEMIEKYCTSKESKEDCSAFIQNPKRE